MKVIHIESGLGNQMLSFAEYLVIKKLNPDDDCYIETILYEIPECGEVICQWFGYELERVFGIKAPNIKELFTQEQWEEILHDVRESKFWLNGWRYAPAITAALNKQGLQLKNRIGEDAKYVAPKKESILKRMLNSRIGYDVKRWLRPFYADRYRAKMDCTKKIFIKTDEDILAGQALGLKQYGANTEFIHNEMMEAFRFPEITDKRNLEMLDIIENTNSVAIHARRGDMLQSNGYCYKYGFFQRATKHIRKHVKDPVFVFFCDTGSISWCQENEDIFGLDFRKDKVYFVDWNTGLEYYRDIQLMAHCKHNIITNSSFGWWGAYLNQNPNKITISPNVWTGTNVHL